MRLVVVRHTSVDVEVGVCYGYSDVPLASTYKNDFVRVSDNLSSFMFHSAYSSPLKRCVLLAEFLFDKMPCKTDSRLKELNFGDWEGLNWEIISETKEAQFWFADWVNAPCPGGESYKQLASRVKAFLNHIKQKHKNDTVLVVTHGGVIRALHSIINRVDIQEVFDIKVGYGDFMVFDLVDKPQNSYTLP